MPVIKSTDMPEDSRMLEWWYNSLDAAVTHEINGQLEKLNRNTGIYGFMMNEQGLALAAMEKGVLIDEGHRISAIMLLEKRQRRLEFILNEFAFAISGHHLNPNSPIQLKEFFYGTLNLPTQYKFAKGQKTVSTDREALEKLQQYSIARPFCLVILALRDVGKKLSVFRTKVGTDGRMRCTFSVAGTETGRWNSRASVWGDGTNLQNITEELRRPFQADPGKILFYCDGEQAESRAVGFIHGTRFGDWRYLDACEAGDLHTTVTQLVWPDLRWTQQFIDQLEEDQRWVLDYIRPNDSWCENRKVNRLLAERPFYRWFTYRDMSKRGGHGTNYYGKPPTMAKHLKVDVGLIASFQQSYLRAFPCFDNWWKDISRRLGDSQSLTTFLGRERTFFGRPDDDATLREAIAFEPQSVVGDIVNEGGLRLMKKYPWYEPLIQVHDAWVGQIPVEQLHMIPEMLSTFQIPITSPCGRRMIIPAEAKVGFNWQTYDPNKNPDGLMKWKGSDERQRREWPNENLLDRVIC